MLVVLIDQVDRCRRAGEQLCGQRCQLIKFRIGRAVEYAIAGQGGQPLGFIPGRGGGTVVGVQNVLLGYPLH